MHFDKKRNLWMGTSEGLCLVSPAEMTHTRETFFLTDKMSRFFPAFKKLDKEVVYTICSDRDGRFFLRTGKGIYSTNRSKSKLDLLIKEDLQSYRSFYGFSEYALQYTQDGILLFGTDRGIGKINMNQKSFSILKHDPADPESLSTNKLCQVLKDRKGNLWVGTVGNGLNKGIPEGDGYRFEHFVHDPDNPFSLHSDEVTHLFMDHEGTVWVGAWSLQRIDESTGQVRFVYPDFIKNFPFDLSHVNVVYIEEDIRSNLFFCISDISLLYDRESRRLDWFYLDRNKSYSNYMKIFVTLDGRQFCSSYPLGIYEIKYPLVRIDSFSVCPEGSDLLYKDDKLFADYYFDMELFEEDGFKDIWTPTFLNFRLTYDEDNKASMVLHHAYTEADGIPYDYYDEMIEHNDQLWATTIKGLACIDRKKKSICNFYSEDGLPTNFFYYGRFKDESGKLYFCTTDGLLFFYPDSVTMPEPPEVRLRSVSIHRKIRLSRKEGISRDSVQTEVVSEIPAGGLRLNYFQNSFTIDYVALDFVNSNGTKYQWNLHDKKRNSDIRGYARQAAFVNLRRGRYIFSVTAANHNNVWNTTGASLDSPTLVQMVCMVSLWFAPAVAIDGLPAFPRSEGQSAHCPGSGTD